MALLRPSARAPSSAREDEIGHRERGAAKGRKVRIGELLSKARVSFAVASCVSFKGSRKSMLGSILSNSDNIKSKISDVRKCIRES